RLGTFAFTSIAASAAFSSARARSTGSSMPSGTAVRGTGTGADAAARDSSELIAGLLHDLHISGDGLARILAPGQMPKPQDAQQHEQRGERERDAEHEQRARPDPPAPPFVESPDEEDAERRQRPEQEEQGHHDPPRPDSGVLRRL